MKKLLVFTCAFICTSLMCFAQSLDNKDNIFISVLLPENENVPNEAAKQLELKLNQLLMQNGIANDDPNSRFVLTTKVSVLTKDIIPGPPQKISMKLDFTFIVGDAEENKKFESTTISSTGVGINETKAFIAALKEIKPMTPELVAFLKNAKQEIVDYYNLRCAEIKNGAEMAAASHDYDKAIYTLMKMPSICDCAEECQTLAVQYNVERVNYLASSSLNKAKSVWASNPTPQGAMEAASIIELIPAGSSSQGALDTLIREINQKLRADQKKEWNFKMQQYNDRIEKQKRDDIARLEQQRANNNYRARQQTANNAARVQAIEAARQVGIVYAKNQQKSITYKRNVILW